MGVGDQAVFGKLDLVFPKLWLAVFVDGCFRDGCPKHARSPRNNTEFWRKKLARNRVRDRLVTLMLRHRGWRVLRIWEHDLARRKEGRCVRRILQQLESARHVAPARSAE